MDPGHRTAEPRAELGVATSCGSIGEQTEPESGQTSGVVGRGLGRNEGIGQVEEKRGYPRAQMSYTGGRNLGSLDKK